jgi:hypothetical protein
MATSTKNQDPWYLRYTTPILFPSHDGFDLSMPQSSFDALVRNTTLSRSTSKDDDDGKIDGENAADAGATIPQEAFDVVSLPSTMADTRTTSEVPPDMPVDGPVPGLGESESGKGSHPFIQGLLSHEKHIEGELDNKMQTENGDIAYRSTNSPLVDLFAELEDVVSGPRLYELLNAAWKEDSLATLKIIFNARSIHLGKSSQITFYRCAGWLAQYHPLTLIANLRWLSRPLIQKKVEEKKDQPEPDMVIIDEEPEKDAHDMTRFDVKHGVSHGYWKDLLNILVLGVTGGLSVLEHPRKFLYVEKQGKKSGKDYVSKEEAKVLRHGVRDDRHDNAISVFSSDPVYRGLYLAVARLFAEQLKTDISLLKNEDHQAKKNISLCAKWAPSHDRFHDKHTFIVSSIAEMLYPVTEITGGSEDMDRELYLRHARERYRKDVAALRAHLDIVERKLTAKSYSQIKYDRVPSVAMNNYAKIFAARDTERFEEYINGVAEGKLRISGATLLPSRMVHDERLAYTAVRMQTYSSLLSLPDNKQGGSGGVKNAALETKLAELESKVRDGQWKSLVQRIKDSGSLESSIAICDVSGSMMSPVFGDGTCPIDSAIGLSLILAEVTKPPFGGHFITFSERPKVQSIDLNATFAQKVHSLAETEWGMNTNFAAVFEELILPMALKNKLTQDDMVKRVFVFSDMQFDRAERDGKSGLVSSFERIKKKYADSGYEMPELVFWNLAGGRAGYYYGVTDTAGDGDHTAPKPVTVDETGTALVSGYSQALLRVFLDNGSFEAAEENEAEEAEVIEAVKEDEDGNVVVDVKQEQAKRQKMDPLSTVKKAISHKAYDPLQVVD